MLRRVVILSAAAAGVLAFSVTFTSWAQSPRWTRLDKIELDIQRPDGCPIEFLDGTYVQRPELPAQIHPRLRQTARNLLTYRVRARNSSERRIELIQLEWTAYDENGEALRSRRTTHRWSSSLRPGRRFSDESDDLPLQSVVSRFELLPVLVVFADGESWIPDIVRQRERERMPPVLTPFDEAPQGPQPAEKVE